MTVLKWGLDLYTGLSQVDDQHEALVALVNRLSELRSGRAEDFDAAFAELTAYAREHFALEERLMEEARVSPEHFDYHRNAHALFVEQLDALRQERERDPAGALDKLLTFLTSWLLQHILQTDRRMALEIHRGMGSEAPHNMFSHF